MSNLKLKIADVPNQYPFIKKKFDIDVYLVDESGQLRSGEDIPLEITVILEDDSNSKSSNNVTSPTIPLQDVLEIVENTNIQKNGAAKVTIMFREVSGNYDNKKFALLFKAVHSVYKITPATSQSMYCIRYKLVVEEENKAPYVWYKDEGGKDKCIEIRVSLRDSENRVVKDRKVPLKALLLYSNNQRVLQQNILVISPDSRAIVDENGGALIKLRINEVSNRHRGQLFQVQICPDTTTSPLTSDVSPAFCMPVDVKSKRNSNVKSKQTDNLNQSASKKQKTTANDPNIFRIDSYSNNVSQNPIVFSSIDQSLSQIQNNQISAVNADAPFRQLSHSIYQPVDSLHNAVNNVVNWATVIMRGIEAIQWREIGFEQNPDKSPNILKPLYNIPNPNFVLTDIVEQYSTNIVDSLKYLQSVSQDDIKTLESTETTRPRPSINVSKVNDDYEQDGIDVFQLPMARGVSFGNTDANVYNPFSPRPGLARETSGNSIIPIVDRPLYNRNNSLFLESSSLEQPPLPIPGLSSSATFTSNWGYDHMFESGSSDESQVNYVIADQIFSYLGISGLPAYNSNLEIIGVYRESLNQEKSTILRFTPINLIIIDEKDVELANDKLQELIEDKSPSVFHISKCRNSIEILRENAMIYFYELEEMSDEETESEGDNTK
eukprot:gene17369-22917_t